MVTSSHGTTIRDGGTPEHRQGDVLRRSVRLERDDRANRRRQRFRRATEEPLAREPELTHAALDERAAATAPAQTTTP